MDMKKIYHSPAMWTYTVECERMTATSSLTGDGSVNTGIIPGEDIFDGTFQSNEENDMNLW